MASELGMRRGARLALMKVNDVNFDVSQEADASVGPASAGEAETSSEHLLSTLERASLKAK